MTQANLSNFFGVKSEEIGLEPVILYDDVNIPLNSDVPLRYPYDEFETLSIVMTYSDGTYTLEAVMEIPTSQLLSPLGNYIQLFNRSGSGGTYVQTFLDTAQTNKTLLSITGGIDGPFTGVGTKRVIGYRRRISQTGLDEIMSALAMPNLFINTWHASPLVVNQRNFDGNWAGLAVGDYGLDMWLKTDATHKGFIVEAGKYTPNARYLVQADGAVKGTITAPSDGNHFCVSFPFAADKFDMRMAKVKVPWHPETSEHLDTCFESYLDYSGLFSVVSSGAAANANGRLFSRRLRRVPTITQAISTGTGGVIAAGRDSTYQVGVHNVDANVATLIFDATIALSEVPDDAQHRFVFN